MGEICSDPCRKQSSQRAVITSFGFRPLENKPPAARSCDVRKDEAATENGLPRTVMTHNRLEETRQTAHGSGIIGQIPRVIKPCRAQDTTRRGASA